MVAAIRSFGTKTLAAYVDGYGNLYIPGREQPVNDARADQIVSIDPYRLIFLSKTGEVGAEKSALIQPRSYEDD